MNKKIIFIGLGALAAVGGLVAAAVIAKKKKNESYVEVDRKKRHRETKKEEVKDEEVNKEEEETEENTEDETVDEDLQDAIDEVENSFGYKAAMFVIDKMEYIEAFMGLAGLAGACISLYGDIRNYKQHKEVGAKLDLLLRNQEILMNAGGATNEG